MKFEREMGYSIATFFLIVGFIAYVETSREVIKMGDQRYQFVGMASLPGQDIYTPVYKRIQ